MTAYVDSLKWIGARILGNTTWGKSIRFLKKLLRDAPQKIKVAALSRCGKNRGHHHARSYFPTRRGESMATNTDLLVLTLDNSKRISNLKSQKGSGAEISPRSEEFPGYANDPLSSIQRRSAHFAMELIHGKWKLAILFALRNGPIRFSQLRKLLPEASKKMLTQHLREMERDGLVIRTDLSSRSRHVEYGLSRSLGSAALRLVDILSHWPMKFQSHD